VHRDLKPSNILTNKYCDIKICDLGLSRGIGISSYERKVPLTEYVVTRWYRAPEVILCPSNYTSSVDIWSAGCIFAELYLGRPIFPGLDDHNDMIEKILQVLGTPSKKDIEFIDDEMMRNYLLKQKNKPRIKFETLCQSMKKKEAIDLLNKMLVFNPFNRFNAEQCLMHSYFDDIREQNFNNYTSDVFNWDFDNIELNKELIQKLIYKESLNFHKNISQVEKKGEGGGDSVGKIDNNKKETKVVYKEGTFIEEIKNSTKI
jgi:mitogen-activated protein kinase 1/3